MAGSISEVLEAVRATLASTTGTNVTLGTPVDFEPGLYIFAYMFSEVPVLRSSMGDTEGSTERVYAVHCLLISSPSNNYVALDGGLRCLVEQPLLAVEGGTVEVVMSSLSTEELARVFESAGILLRLAMPFELRWTGS